jgi:membrane-associated HD superfamily phosphohydrolase
MRNKEYETFDERQVKERGTIFKLAYVLLVVFSSVTAVLSETTTFWNEHFSPFQSNTLGVMVVTTVCTVLMITRNAYVSPIKPKATNLTVGLVSICSVEGLVCNVVSFDLFYAAMTLCTSVICCTYWVKLLIDGKSASVEDDDE